MSNNNELIVLSEVEVDEVSGADLASDANKLWDDVKTAWHNFWCCKH